MMRRILMLGPPGAGKSTLARRMGAALNLPVIHLDRYYWKPGWVATPREEWIRIQEELVARPEWIIDGNYGSTLDVRLPAADTIIYLDEPALRCVGRILARTWRNKGRPRPDLNDGCPESLRWDIFGFAWYTLRFNRRSRPHVMKALEGCRGGAEITVLKGRGACDAFMAALPTPAQPGSR